MSFFMMPRFSARPVLRVRFLKSAAASLWLSAAVIFSGVFVIEEREHEHVYHGDTCHICQEMQIAQRLIEAAGGIGLWVISIGFLSYIQSVCVKPRRVLRRTSLIALKIKLSC
jgi:hypothetical protein